ncbi:hypothetical protein HK104_001387 [Borealophlyctis nickersoniae]|nr:hypothetical protein HK104_001387 [Borealophlyctis nickersoniae]
MSSAPPNQQVQQYDDHAPEVQRPAHKRDATEAQLVDHHHGDSGPPATGMNNIEDYDNEGSDEDGKAMQRAGRRKIKIEYIDDKSRRHITFSKRKAGIMKKAYELSTLTGTQVLLLVASETGHVYTFATPKLQPLITKPDGKNLIQACLNAPDPVTPQPLPAYPVADAYTAPSYPQHPGMPDGTQQMRQQYSDVPEQSQNGDGGMYRDPKSYGLNQMSGYPNTYPAVNVGGINPAAVGSQVNPYMYQQYQQQLAAQGQYGGLVGATGQNSYQQAPAQQQQAGGTTPPQEKK